MKTNVHVCRKIKYNQRPCNTNGLELQCNLYGKNLRTRYLILAIMSHYMYLKRKKPGPMKTSKKKMVPFALYTSYWLLLLIRSWFSRTCTLIKHLIKHSAHRIKKDTIFNVLINAFYIASNSYRRNCIC